MSIRFAIALFRFLSFYFCTSRFNTDILQEDDDTSGVKWPVAKKREKEKERGGVNIDECVSVPLSNQAS